MNIPDIERVVQYGMNIDKDLGDINQRVGRAARREGRTAIGVIFLPYWYFDYQGQEPNKRCTATADEVPSARSVASRCRRATKNAMRRERKADKQQEKATRADDSDSLSSSEDDGSITQTEGANDMFSWENEECVRALSHCQALVD